MNIWKRENPIPLFDEQQINNYMSNVQQVKDKVWENEEKECGCYGPIRVYISNEILDDMRLISDDVSSTEFSALLKYKMIKHSENDNSVILVEGYYIPEQEVSITSAKITGEIKRDFKGILHKHPSGMNNFSTTDEDNIHKNFSLSLLLVDGEIKTGMFKDTCSCGGVIKRDIEIFKILSDDTKNRIKKMVEKIKAITYQYDKNKYMVDMYGSIYGD